MSRPATISVDIGAIRHNFSIARRAAPDARVVACIKANAYGHGMREVAKALPDADMFGVASIDEALALRESIPERPILLLEGSFERSEIEDIEWHAFETVIHSHEQLSQFLAAQLSRPVSVWLKIDTGMHRLGFDMPDVADAFRKLQASPNCAQIRLMTHFACAEELDNPFTRQQIDCFNTAAKDLDAASSLSNSAAILAWPDAHREWIRPGFMLYGNSPFSQPHDLADQLRSAMTFSTRIISVRSIKAGEGVGYNHFWRAPRDSVIAVAAAGYGDGYPRNTANGCPVLVNGVEAKTVGHVAMDLLTIDVTDLAAVSVGDPVELWGPNLSVNRVAAHSGYSPYELLTRLPRRARRTYS
jgi:alanine racemase